ncbi:MAG: DUF6057 family protein [Fermentimonas sp.]|nr:DUF6057 family protein [Fermentimonas sp.]
MSIQKKPWLIYSLVFVLFFIFLQFTSEFHFYNIEQDQLFRFSSNYFHSIVSLPGGYALYLSNFLLQFFGVKYLSAFIMALLLTTTLFFTAKIINKISGSKMYLILSLSPAVFLMFAQFDEYYKLQGTVALLFAITAVYGYTFINKFPIKQLYLIITVPALYVLGGSVFSLFSISIIAYELLLKKERWWVSCLNIFIITAVVAVSAVYFGSAANYNFVLLPNLYYNPLLKPTVPLSLYAWISFILCMIIGGLSQFNKKPITSGKRIIIISAQLIIIVAVFVITNMKIYDPERENYVRFDYYSYTSQWDKIIELYKQTGVNNYLYLNILNRALAEKGILADQMFDFDQNGFNSILVDGQLPRLFTDLFYTTGDIATSQRFAFESYVTYDEMISPRMLQRLIETNLIFGAYPVAEKYISLLEQSLMYNTWATNHRVFLYDDQAIENDSIFGPKRRGLPKHGSEFDSSGIIGTLEKIAVANPADQIAIQYLGIAHLLNKDMSSFGEIIKKYYGTEVLPTLPKSFSEALALLIDDNAEGFEDYEIPQETQSKFNEFKKTIIENKKNPYLETLIKNQYGGSYWYYYLFV